MKNKSFMFAAFFFTQFLQARCFGGGDRYSFAFDTI